MPAGGEIWLCGDVTCGPDGSGAQVFIAGFRAYSGIDVSNIHKQGAGYAASLAVQAVTR
jgi:hypothetical protein